MSTRGDRSISIVIPAYNEARRIGVTLERIERYFSGFAREVELIVVDDGSTDGTASIVAAFQGTRPTPVRLLRNPENAGKGMSVRRGVLEAKGDLILFSDADLSTPIEEYSKLEERVLAGFDLAIGSRVLPGSELIVRQPRYREWMGRILSILVRFLGLTEVEDTQCGFKLFARPAGQMIFEAQVINRFGFDVEILWLARKLGFKVAEVPVRWINDSNTRVRPAIDSIWTLIDVFRIYQREIQGRYPCSVPSIPSGEEHGRVTRKPNLTSPLWGRTVDVLEEKERMRREETGDVEYEQSDPLTRTFFATRLRLFASLAEDHLPRSRGIRILDAGCGDGYLLLQLRERLASRSPALYGCDFSVGRLAEAQRRTNGAHVSVANIKALPFSSDCFDLVLCTDVLEHVVEPARAVRELTRTVKPGGLLLFAIPHEGWWQVCRALLLRFPLRVSGHINDLSPAWIRPVLPEWEVVKVQTLPLRQLPWLLALHATVLMRKPG